MKIVLFSGGVGSRMWPLSRKKNPKQFTDYVDNKTMFQLAVNRISVDFPFKDIYVSTGKQYKQMLQKQEPKIVEKNMFLEPEMKDCGPAVGLSAAYMAKYFPEEPVAIIWAADHLVKDTDSFLKMLHAGKEYAKEHPSMFAFFGQKPRFATPNLGWIHTGEPLGKVHGIDGYTFTGWHYRPPVEKAREYFSKGSSAWNPGYFITSSTNLWQLYKTYAPEMFEKLMIIQEAMGKPTYQKVLEKIYPTLEKIHFDNLILERISHDKAIVLVADFGWSDVGSFEQLKEALQETPEANVTQGNVLTLDTTDSLIYNVEDSKLIATIDLDDIVIVNTPDALLVSKKSSVSKIKTIVEQLKDEGHEELI